MQTTPFFSLLNNFLSDLNLVNIGDFGSSSSWIISADDISLELTGISTTTSLTSCALLQLLVLLVDSCWWSLEPRSSVTTRPVLLTWLWSPQTSTFVGKFWGSVGNPRTELWSWDECPDPKFWFWDNKPSFPPCLVSSTEPTVFLQRGQVEWDWNHMSMQSTWNPWLHPGKTLALSPSTRWERQTAHSSPSLKSQDLKTRIGMDWRVVESRPALRGGSSWPWAKTKRRRWLLRPMTVEPGVSGWVRFRLRWCSTRHQKSLA